MKTGLLLPAALLLAAAAALANDPPEPIPGLPTPMPSPLPGLAPEEVSRRLAVTRHLTVPIPKKTPFDADRAARRAYLKAYRTAYRQTAAGFLVDPIWLANMPYFTAVLAGHGDGQTAAVKAGLWMHPITSSPTPR